MIKIRNVIFTGWLFAAVGRRKRRLDACPDSRWHTDDFGATTQKK
jgi:hypothetical protein